MADDPLSFCETVQRPNARLLRRLYHHHHRVFDQLLKGAEQFGTERAVDRAVIGMAGSRHRTSRLNIRNLDFLPSLAYITARRAALQSPG